MNIFGIHYNWHVHPTVGEVYHHYFIGMEYDSDDKGTVSVVTKIRKYKDYYTIFFQNGNKMNIFNVNKVIITNGNKNK